MNTQTAPSPATVPTTNVAATRRWLLLGAYALAALGGAFIGLRGSAPLTDPRLSLTPLACFGYALRLEEIPRTAGTARGSDRDWAQLQQDLLQVRESWPSDTRALLEMLIAARGLDNRGEPQLERVRQLCLTQHWPRCDEDALRAVGRQGLP